jgi:hypothetical protein
MGIRAKWQFQDFCRENPLTNEEFKCTVQKMISAEERTRERFGDGHDNWENYDNRGNQGGQQNRKRRPDNMFASTDKSKKSNKPRRFEDLENIPCPWHPNSSHTAGECRNFKNYTRKNDSGKGKGKEDDNNKD